MKKVLFFFSFVILALILSAATCGPKNYKGPDDPENCAPACQKLRDMGCEEGEDLVNHDGTRITCEEWCVDTLKEGHGLNPTHILKEEVDTCEEIEDGRE